MVEKRRRCCPEGRRHIYTFCRRLGRARASTSGNAARSRHPVPAAPMHAIPASHQGFGGSRMKARISNGWSESWLKLEQESGSSSTPLRVNKVPYLKAPVAASQRLRQTFHEGDHRSAESVRVAGDVGAAVTCEEIEVGAFVGLLDVLDVKALVAAVGQRRRGPVCAAGSQFGFCDFQS